MALPKLDDIVRGDDITFRLEIKDDQANPIDITGWNILSTMKLSTEDTDDDAPVKVTHVVPAGDDATNGIANIVLPNAQTANLLPTTYFIDFQKVLGGVVNTILVATVNVTPDVTTRTS